MRQVQNVFLNGEVNESMTALLWSALQNGANSNQDAHIVISTFGGCVYEALAMLDMMKTYPYKITTVGIGAVMSAGTILLQGGSTRLVSKHCQLMFHYGAEISESHADAQQNKKLTALIKDLYQKSSTASAKTISGWMKQDKYMSAGDAIRYGFADRVVGE